MPLQKPAASPRPRRGTLTRKLILDVSAALFQKKGYDRTSLDDIAGALSVTKPSLYYHVTNKEDILIECVTAAFQQFQGSLALHDDPSKSGRQRMEILLRLYLDVITSDVGGSIVIADDRVMSPAGKELYRQFRRTLNDALEERLMAGVADGSIDVPETMLTTFAIFGMFNWVSHWYFGRHAIPREIILERFMAILFGGIEKA